MAGIATIGDVNVDLIIPVDKMPDLGKQVIVRDIQNARRSMNSYTIEASEDCDQRYV